MVKSLMPRCPVCGAKVDKPIKIWELKPKNRHGNGVKIGIFICPNGHKFRAKIT